MASECRFICLETSLIWNRQLHTALPWEGPGGESLSVSTWKHMGPGYGDAIRSVNRIRFEFGGPVNLLRKSVIITPLHTKKSQRFRRPRKHLEVFIISTYV